MKKIYKIKFEFESSNDPAFNREQNILAILSELEDIESDSPLPVPSDFSIISIGSDEYQIMDHKYSFQIQDGNFYYQTILKIKSLSQINYEKQQSKKREEDAMIQKLRELAGVKKWKDSNWDNSSFI